MDCRVASHSLSTINNCHVMDSGEELPGAVVIRDDEEGQDLTLIKLIGQGGGSQGCAATLPTLSRVLY